MKLAVNRLKLILIPFIISSKLYAVDKDKQMHFGISAALTAGGYTVCRVATDMSKTGCILTNALSVLAIGMLKEIQDRDHNSLTESGKDLAADSLGIGVGLLITIPF